MNMQSTDETDRRLAAELKPKIITACREIENNLNLLGPWLTDYKERKLYRFEHPTFAAFVKAELPFKTRRAYQIVEASAAFRSLPENVQPAAHLTVKHGLALSKVEPKERVEVMEKATEAAASEQRPMTARDIKEAAAPDATEKPAQKGLNLRRDKTGYVIPPPIQALWDRSDGIHRDLTRKLREIKESLADAYDRKDKALSTMTPHRQGLLLAFDDLIERLRELDPYAVCFYCQGQNTKDCMACKGRGFISKFAMTMVPKELIEVRARANKAP